MNIEDKILELCSEDDYGVWELWWAVKGQSNQPSQTNELMSAFVRAMSHLVATGKIVARRRNSDSPTTGRAVDVAFSESALRAELEGIAKPQPDEMYWFGTP